MKETIQEKKAKRAREYADSVDAKKITRAEIKRLRAELDELRKVDVTVSSMRDTKSFPIRMSPEIRNAFADIATEQQITQAELVTHFVHLYDACDEDRAILWKKLFATREQVLDVGFLGIQELEVLLEKKKKEQVDKEKKRTERVEAMKGVAGD